MKVGIIQSNYIPWRGYFDIIKEVDTFIFLDDVLYSKGSWRNRNRIKTNNGVKWLTVPLPKRGLSKMAIDEVPLTSDTWQEEHFLRLREAYQQAPHFANYESLLVEIYRAKSWTTLSEMNQFVIKKIAELLGCDTEFVDARTIQATGAKDDRVLQLLTAVGATEYLSGPSARDYMDESRYKAHNIDVLWKKYDYPEYPQIYPPYEAAVSILDLLFMTGAQAPQYIWDR